MPAPELDPVTSVSGPGPDRPDGYADLRSYAPIGDTRTVALVALDGRIDWWPIPDLDSCPTFAAILDAPNGGRLELAPTEPARTTRRSCRARTSWRPRTSPRPGPCASSTRSTPAGRAVCRGPSSPAGSRGSRGGCRCASRSPPARV